MNQRIQDAMKEATRLTRSGSLSAATALIQRALAGLKGRGPDTPVDRQEQEPLVLDDCIVEVPDRTPPTKPVADRSNPQPVDLESSEPGSFNARTYTHGSLTRKYKLYIPPSRAGQGARPLVVMLHGCTQDPDDFAAGTHMNSLADERGFLVLYPAQSQDANPSRCWNWFKHNHQRRGSGEAALIASMTKHVVEEHGVDPRRVYVAGLSAGGAMAAVVADAYPELFAAVGVHSGLAAGAASNLGEALAAMNTGSAGLRTAQRTAATSQPDAPLHESPMPTIVFHGDEDRTVHPKNGEQAWRSAIERHLGPTSDAEKLRTHAEVSARGRRSTRTVAIDLAGKEIAEHWLVHGAGHAWAGGSSDGSYTDPSGPDASVEMIRFFFDHPHKTAH